VVPRKSLQIETGFVMEKNQTELSEEKLFAYNTSLLRYGLLDNLELRLGLEYLGEKASIKNIDTTYNFSGLSPIYMGLKIKITEEEGWKPEIAFLGGMVFPFTADAHFRPKYSAANMRLSLSHTLSDRFSIGYNIGAEWDGEIPAPAYFYSVALRIGLTDKFGMYVEGFGLLPEEGDSQHQFDAGFTYLVLPNFQLDISGGIGLNDYAMDNFLGFGLTYRFSIME